MDVSDRISQRDKGAETEKITVNLGFVDLETARSDDTLVELEGCYVRYVETITATDRCRQLLGEQGVTVYDK